MSRRTPHTIRVDADVYDALDTIRRPHGGTFNDAVRYAVGLPPRDVYCPCNWACHRTEHPCSLGCIGHYSVTWKAKP